MADFEVGSLYTKFENRGLNTSISGIKTLKQRLMEASSAAKLAVSAYVAYKTAVVSVAAGFISAARQAEDYRTSIRAVSKSIKEADETFDRIRHWAEVNPIDTDQAVGAFVRLRTAAVANSEEAMKSLADLATVMHADLRDVAGAVVTTEVETLRRFGIILNREGKQATIQFGESVKTVNKDIASIRRGIIEIIQENLKGAMQNAKDTFSGTLATMGGMWTGFKQKVMEGKGGPFEAIKQQLRDVRDEWEAFTSSPQYDEFVANIQRSIVSAIQSATTAVKTLASAINIARENAELLKTAIVGLIAYKGALAITAALASFNAQVSAGLMFLPQATSLISRMATAYAAASIQIAMGATKVGIFKTAIVGLGAALKTLAVSIGPAGWIATAVSAGYWLLLRDQIKAANEAAERTKAIFDSVDKTFKNATVDTIESNLRRLERQLNELTGAAITANKAMLALSSQEFSNRNGILGGGVAGAIKELGAGGRYIKDVKDQIAALEKQLENAKASNESDAGNIKTKPPTDSKGKSAAEKLVNSIRDQIKYLNADGASFLSILDKWIAKSKVLSDDWKVLKDLQNEITDEVRERVISMAKDERERRDIEEKQHLEKFKADEERRSGWLSRLSWGNSQGLVSDTSYLSQLKAKFAEVSAALNLTMEDFTRWPESLKALFESIQSGVTKQAQSALDLLKKQFENGTMSLGQYNEALERIKAQYADIPLLINNITAAQDAARASVMTFSESLRSSLADATKDFNDLAAATVNGVVDGFARAIAYGDDLGESLKKLGQDIIYTVTKMLIMQQVASWFGGSSGAGNSFSAAKANSLTWLAALEGNGLHSGGIVGKESSFVRHLPKFHSGGINSNEQLAILKKGEGVFTPEQMKALGGIGAAVPNIEINIENKTGTPIQQKQTSTQFDGKKYVIGVVLEAIQNNTGGMRTMLKGA